MLKKKGKLEKVDVEIEVEVEIGKRGGRKGSGNRNWKSGSGNESIEV